MPTQNNQPEIFSGDREEKLRKMQMGGQHNNAEDNNDETTTQKCTGNHGQWRSGQARQGLPVRGADTMWVTTAPSMLGNMATPFQGGVSTSDRKS